MSDAPDDTLPGGVVLPGAMQFAASNPLRDGAVLASRDEARLDRALDEAAARREHESIAARMRTSAALGCATWAACAVFDVVLARWVVPSSLTPYLVVRAAALVVLVACAWRLRRRASLGLLRVLDVVTTGTCSLAITVMCLFSGGLLSPYTPFIALVLIGRAAALASPWRVGAPLLCTPLVVHGVVLLVLAGVDDALAAQLHDPYALSYALFFGMFLVAAWLLAVIGGHNASVLRQSLTRTRSLGRYQLRTRLGRGGMGEVWVAFHEQLRREVALKILRPEYGTDRDEIDRFVREVRTTSRLTHPNTVHIFEHGATEDGLWYYAMELLEGVDLEAMVRRDGALPVDVAVTHIRAAAAALAEAHRLGIVHCDVKPSNIFVARTRDGQQIVKVLDFGIARSAEPHGAELGHLGRLRGTPAYLSPEAARGESLGPAADVYGLGLTLYWSLTGAMPFSGSTFELLAQHLHGEVVPPSRIVGHELPAGLDTLVLRCLAKQPDDRFATAAALVAALDVVPPSDPPHLA